jgi:cell division protein FtsB
VRAQEQGRRRRLRVHSSVFLIVVAGVLCLAAIRMWGPIATERRQQRELVKLRTEKAALQTEHKRLEESRRNLASEEGLEAAARARGYVKEGDRLLKFVPGKEDGKPPAAAAEPPTKTK